MNCVRRVFAVLLFICWTSAFATEGPVRVKVGLNPMGSFEMVSPRLIGSGEKHGDVFTAKELKVLVMSTTTGMSLRDKHMHKKLEADKFPMIVVSDVKASNGKGTAKIKIRDVSKDIQFTFKDEGSGKATAEFPLSLKNFKISGINYNGVGVEDEVHVTATVPYVTK